MGQVVSQFIHWTNEIFGGLFNFTANHLTKNKKIKKTQPSRGLMLFYNALHRKGFKTAGKVKVTK